MITADSGWSLTELELDVEGAADRQEEIEVDEGAREREEDLLDGVAAEDPGEGRAGDHRRHHDQEHETAEVRRQDPVQRDRDGVAGEDVEPARLRVGVLQDRVPRVAGGHRLEGLEGAVRDERPERDRRQRVPQLREPASQVPAEQVRERAAHDEEDSPRKPAAPVHARIFGRARMPVFIPTG
jgi:hypothetical protein